jgi:hypothetical protein
VFPGTLPKLCQPYGKLLDYTRKHGKKQAGELGFEPRLTDPESVVLPLHYSPSTAISEYGELTGGVKMGGRNAGVSGHRH